MQSRAIRYIKTFFSPVTKLSVLAAFVFILVVSLSSTVSAQGMGGGGGSPVVITPPTVFSKATTKEQLDKRYSDFINLFSSSSSLISNGPLGLSSGGDFAVGLSFTLNLEFDITNQERDAGWHWDRTASDKSDAFLIMLCEAAKPSSCWLNSIPYSENGTDNTKNTVYAKKADVFTSYESVNVATFGSPNQPNNPGTKYKYNSITSEIEDYIGAPLLRPGQTYNASLWYCAGAGTNAATTSDQTTVGTLGASAYKEINANNPRVRTFDDLCDGLITDGTTYYQIGQTIPVVIPKTAEDITAAAATAQEIAGQNNTVVANPKDNLPTCGVVPGFQSGTVVGCLAQLVYYGIYKPIEWVAGLFGSLFDFFIGYSVSDESYRYSFAVTGWKLVRDIANIMFIIILVYTGFAAVFSFGGTGGTTMRRVVPALIINALIINFSLFATRTVIDLSNVTARVFYSRMIVCAGECIDADSNGVPENIKRSWAGGYWPLSEKIVSAFNPQKMFQSVTLEPKEAATEDTSSPMNTTTAAQEIELQQRKGFDQNSFEYAGYYALVSLLAAIIMLFIGIMFFKVMFMFLGRVIGLYIAMIFSPFAFLTRGGGGGFFKITAYEWQTWAKDLFNYAALAPIFIFFLYIIFSFLNTDMIAQIGIKDTGGSFFGTLMGIAIPMLIIYKLVEKGAKLAEKYAGEFGMVAQNILGKAAGIAGGVALGGTALLGSNTIGRYANKLTDNEKFKDWAGNNGRFGKMALRTVDSIGKGSFDARKTKIVGEGSKKFGLDLNQKSLSMAGLDSKSLDGGYRKVQEEKIKDAEGYKKLLVSKKSDDEMKATFTQQQLQERAKYDERMDAKLKTRWAAKVQKDAIENGTLATAQQLSEGAWKDYKKSGKTKAEYEKGKDSYQKTRPPAIHVTTSERNKARTNAYAESKEKKSGGAFATQNYYDKIGNLVYKKGELARNPYADDDLYATPLGAGTANGAKIAPIAKKGTKIAKKNAHQAFRELGEGFAKGAATGALVGSIVPVVGTALGAAAGGMLGGIREVLNYSGTTNKKIGKTVRTEAPKKDKIIDDLINEMGGGATTPPPATPPPSTPPPSAGAGPTTP